MKVSVIQNLSPVEGNNKKVLSRLNHSCPPLKKESGALECFSNYNIAFNGLIPKKPETSDFESGVNIEEPVNMVPNKEYRVSKDSSFLLGGYTLSLNDSRIVNSLNKIPLGGELIIGRNSNPEMDLPAIVSRKHLKIRKDENGGLYASDLNSLNGSVILPDITKISSEVENLKLEPQKKYLIPKNSMLSLGDTIFPFCEYGNLFSNIRVGDTLIIGRDENTDIKLNSATLSRKHLAVTKARNGYIVKDLNSTNGTTFIKDEGEKANIPYAEDYSSVSDVVTLRANVPTLLPKNSQLNIGGDFTLDTRNPNLLRLLDEKGKIKIGRNHYCDVRVSGFHDSVSREHLFLQKSGDNIIATDINPKNPTKVVPQNRIKAFYSGVKNIRLSQSNVGDCYLLSTIYALSQNPKGQFLLENMVSVDQNGNYIVRFNDGVMRKVKPEELDGQSDFRGRFSRTAKYSVSGELGAKALERAYGKMIKSGSENNECTMFAEIDKGGRPEKALKLMTGIESVCYAPSPSNTPFIFSEIASNGQENYIMTCCTPQEGKYGSYADRMHRFNSKHAFAVKNINTVKKTVEIVNPHNTKISDVISWHEFSNIFSEFIVAKI